MKKFLSVLFVCSFFILTGLYAQEIDVRHLSDSHTMIRVSADKKFILLPIQEDIRSISISLPDGANAQDYAQMWLELINTKNGQRIHYVMTDRMQYTFPNIIRNTSWNVVLRNERGDVFGQRRQ